VEFELLADGYAFLEAPRIDAHDNLYFTDIHIGGIFKRAPDGSIVHLLADRNVIGGLAFNRDGRIVASGAGGLILFDERTGQREMLLEQLDGQPIPVINDIQPDGEGGLYAGVVDIPERNLAKAVPSPLLHVSSDRRVRRVMEGTIISNGIGLSPDRKTIYHADTAIGILAYDRAPDGSCSNRRLLVDHPRVDGLAVDEEGGIWVATIEDAAIKRFLPDGRLERSIAIPAKRVLSLAFGGKDRTDLYIVTGSPANALDLERDGKVFRTRSDVRGLATPLTQF
jgi:D-xylonolactonase